MEEIINANVILFTPKEIFSTTIHFHSLKQLVESLNSQWSDGLVETLNQRESFHSLLKSLRQINLQASAFGGIQQALIDEFVLYETLYDYQQAIL